ncbi:MAG TPA: alanine racemase [Eubacterium sp.]|nr:alanine racemase [Eubacterium sp.]
MDKYYRVFANIDLDAIRDNILNLKSRLKPETGIIGVVKADGYGHGAIEVARAIEDLVYGFAVATLDEAVNFRKNGITKPIIILGYVFKDEYVRLVEYEITATIFSYENAKLISDIAASLDRIAKCHIKIDTGMRRIGFTPNDASIEEIKKINGLSNLTMEGIFTHFATADDSDKTFAKQQFKTFMDFIDRLEAQGIRFKFRHCANSAAIIDMPETSLELVRGGIAIYGMYPSDDVDHELKLRPALELKSNVVMVKDVMPGESISYGRTYIADKPMKVATIPVGYGDGYPRSLSSKGYVLIKGEKAPILGRICMDQMMVDVTHIIGVEEETPVTLIGRDKDAYISVEEIAGLSGTFNYEFVCDLGKRIPRCYYRHGRIIGTRDYF